METGKNIWANTTFTAFSVCMHTNRKVPRIQRQHQQLVSQIVSPVSYPGCLYSTTSSDQLIGKPGSAVRRRFLVHVESWGPCQLVACSHLGLVAGKKPKVL